MKKINKYVRPLLSICIPTFNRCEYLDYLLDNIKQQVGLNSELVQVVISDNFSTDATFVVVDKYQKEGLNLKYLRNCTNQGFTANLNSTIQGADGEYCWLMGDDDAFRPGAISYLSELIKSNRPDVAISNRYICDLKMNILQLDQFLSSEEDRRLFDFNNYAEIIEYFKSNTSTIGMFNFISVLVIRRDAWLKSSSIPGVSTTLFSHVFKVIDILRNQSGKLLYISAQTVFARTDNDRLDDFHEGSEFKKWQIHFQGNIEIADHFFADDPVVYDLFVHPVKAIIEAGKAHYLTLAEKEGFLDNALKTLKKLNIS